MKPVEDIKRHIPQRTCIACKRVMPKRELNRLVRTTSGAIQPDPGGRLAGRGAYLCSGCLKEGIKPKQLEHTLKTTITENDVARLAQSFTRMGQ
ncbi:MAG: YlxR family protein [Chloroflexota bacterium]